MSFKDKVNSSLTRWSYGHKEINKNLLKMKQSVDELNKALKGNSKKKK